MEIKFRPQDQNPTIQSHHRNNLTLRKPYLDLDKERGIEKMLDGANIRMLRVVHNVSWRDNIPNKTLYGDLQPISNVIRKRNLKLAGPDTFRDKSSPAHSLCSAEALMGFPVVPAVDLHALPSFAVCAKVRIS